MIADHFITDLEYICISQRYSSGTVPVPPFLLVSAAWRCSVTHEGCIHYADTEQEAQLPQRNSASAAHVEGGWG